MTSFELTITEIGTENEMLLPFEDQENAYLIHDYIKISNDKDYPTDYDTIQDYEKEKIVQKFIKIFGDGNKYTTSSIYTESIQYFDQDDYDDNYLDDAQETFGR